MPKKYKLFSVYGIEAEYMIVDKDTLKVKAIADEVLRELNNGIICNEVELGKVSWSNELVNHVLEIKCTNPEASLNELDIVFHNSIKNIQKILEKWNCCLMPTAMNPWFIPAEETVLWPHDQREIYNLYNEIFDCRGHGWSNLQSVHINLPYENEIEFVKLHSAIRLILPLIPYFSASSPFYEGKKQEFADNRLAFYEKNQAKVPSIIGNIIPENVKSLDEYKEILKGIYKDISHYDNTKTLQNPWLNSRAAIPKFDVGAIEIRLMDIQESPYMDFTLVNLFVEMTRYVVNLPDEYKSEKIYNDHYLRSIYDQSKSFSPDCELTPFANLFSIELAEGSFEEFRKKVIEKFSTIVDKRYASGLNLIRDKGSLAQRLVQNELSKEMYKDLMICLKENIPFDN